MSWDVGVCARRADEKEAIDIAPADARAAAAWRFHERFARWIGARRSLRPTLNAWSARWTKGVPVTFLDLQCGRGGLSRFVADWARSAGREVRVLGVDTSTDAVAAARERHRGVSDLTFEVRRFDDPQLLPAQQFDHVISSNGLHRADDGAVVAWLRAANRLAKRGFFVEDGLRDVRAYCWMTAAARLLGGAAVAREVGLAVRRGFTAAEVEGFLKELPAGSATAQVHLGYRFSISGERGLNVAPTLAPAVGLAV